MEERVLKHLYPTLEMLAEELNLAGFTCRVVREAGELRFRGARRVSGQGLPAQDVICVPGRRMPPSSGEVITPVSPPRRSPARAAAYCA